MENTSKEKSCCGPSCCEGDNATAGVRNVELLKGHVSAFIRAKRRLAS